MIRISVPVPTPYDVVIGAGLLPQTAAEGFNGTICFEYFPAGDTEAGFPALHRLEALF